jgi:transcriptional regulator with XRE-family HTH domain
MSKGPATVGERIRQARLTLAARRGETVTQSWLAAQCGVAGPTVSQWEAGIAQPSLGMIPKVAAALQVTAGWLAFGEESVPDLINPATDRKLTDEEIDRARAAVAAARASKSAARKKGNGH